MKDIRDIGKKGAEYMDVSAPTPQLAAAGVDKYIQLIAKFPVSRMTTEMSDGIKQDIEVHTLLLKNKMVFKLIHDIAPYEPIVYARKGDRTAMGIISPNYDAAGVNRLPTIKVLPLKQAYPLTSRGSNLLPDARMATMLAGSAHAEGAGSGSHNRPVSQDFEHKLTIIGALSLGRQTISGPDGSHVQHSMRSSSSVATGLSNGQLGNVFAASGERTAGFSGYGLPLLFEPSHLEATDTIFIPKGFLEQEAAYGVHYPDAARITYGASLQILHARKTPQAVSDQLQRIAGNSSAESRY